MQLDELKLELGLLSAHHLTPVRLGGSYHEPERVDIVEGTVVIGSELDRVPEHECELECDDMHLLDARQEDLLGALVDISRDVSIPAVAATALVSASIDELVAWLVFRVHERREEAREAADRRLRVVNTRAL